MMVPVPVSGSAGSVDRSAAASSEEEQPVTFHPPSAGSVLQEEEAQPFHQETVHCCTKRFGLAPANQSQQTVG